MINHTSDQHPWFQARRSATPDSPERDYYVWSDTDQRYSRRAHHLHRHRAVQLDLGPGRRASTTGTASSATSPTSTSTTRPSSDEMIRRSCASGSTWASTASGCDAIPYLFEREGTNCENLPETPRVPARSVRAEIDAHYADRMLLAEANQWPADVRPYFGDGDECHMAFHFPLMPRIFMALRQEDAHARSSRSWRRRRRFPTTASGASSCATTTS